MQVCSSYRFVALTAAARRQRNQFKFFGVLRNNVCGLHAD
jgi:hypothetical protein